MELKALSLNCQRAYQPGLKHFLRDVLAQGTYDFLLLQEAEEVVLPSLAHDHYKLVRAFNDEAGEHAQVCIVHRSGYPLLRHGFQSFSSMRNDPFRGFTHPSFGFLWGDFSVSGALWRLGSTHLHSGIDRRARKAELVLAKQRLFEERPISTILAGDFNAGYPGESGSMARILAPEFYWATRHAPPTLDSRYSEPVAHLPNQIANALARFNIKVPLWTDQVFVDSETAERATIQCKVLPHRVSDHSPVEIIIT